MLDGLSRRTLSIIAVALDNLLQPDQREISEMDFQLAKARLSEKKISPPSRLRDFFNLLANWLHTKASPIAILEQKEKVQEKITPSLIANEASAKKRQAETLKAKQENLIEKKKKLDQELVFYRAQSRLLRIAQDTPKLEEALKAFKVWIDKKVIKTKEDQQIIKGSHLDKNRLLQYALINIKKIEAEKDAIVKELKSLEIQSKNIS